MAWTWGPASEDGPALVPGIATISDRSLAGRRLRAHLHALPRATRTSTRAPSQENLARYAASGIHGYLALGSNGENRSLSEEERLEVLDIVVRHRGAGQVVMAGATYDGQRQAERFLQAAADLGADYGLVLAPGYFRKQMTVEVLYRYFSTLADSSPLPLLLYNAPGFNGLALEPALVERLAAHPNIVGMKDSAALGHRGLPRAAAPDFAVLAGSANFLFRGHAGGLARRHRLPGQLLPGGRPPPLRATALRATRSAARPSRTTSRASTTPSPALTAFPA